MAIVLQLLLLAVGFVLLMKGADWFVDGSAGIAARFQIPQLVIGLTIVAMGTSAPEAAVSITAALKGSAELTVGNIVGSNTLNILMILGITSVLTPVAVRLSTIRYEIPYMLLTTALLIALSFTGTITFVGGIILWAAFLLYLTYLFFTAKRGKAAEETEPSAPKPFWKLLLLTAIGLALIILGSQVTVNAATTIALQLGISERVIGLTVLALGTSLPELFTSVTAARKGNADIAIGNIVGSNVFNILFVLGTAALITPIPCAPPFLIDMVVVIAAGAMLWLCSWKKKSLGRRDGVLMLIAYAAYFIYLMQ